MPVGGGDVAGAVELVNLSIRSAALSSEVGLASAELRSFALAGRRGRLFNSLRDDVGVLP